MRVSIFIDGNNFYHGLRNMYGEAKALKKFSFERFTNFLALNREIINIFYYNAALDKSSNPEKFESQREFFDALRKIPKFNVILCKLLKRKIRGTNQYYYVLKEDDINMAADMLKGAFKNYYDVAILVSGDGDFVPAVKIVKEEGKRVENVYFKKSASNTLKQNCDNSLMLKKEILDAFFITDQVKKDGKNQPEVNQSTHS